MTKYCCFFCPQKDFSDKALEDQCPLCGRQYKFVFDQSPVQIREYTITKSLGRGFYGATYVVEHGPFRRLAVLKVTPSAFYPYFDKPTFEQETDTHARLATTAEHVIGIIDRFESDVTFRDGSSLSCCITVLEYVQGDLLRSYIEGAIEIDIATTCQIAVDLLRMRAEFQANKLNHNDLHSENIIVERLGPNARRPKAIQPSIRVVAIDLGSVADSSKSTDQRYGDLLFIATHVDRLIDKVLERAARLVDREYRIALVLQSVLQSMLAAAQNTRQPADADFAQQIEQVYAAVSQAWRPWEEPLRLRGFGDHYNALTLDSWNVPKLIVDPAGRWLSEVARPGPQIITGMRGCGKTMLLRALDIHARAAKSTTETNQAVIDRLQADKFVGLFVSAQRLLDLRQSILKVEHRLTRLFVHYALQAARALLHLSTLREDLVVPLAHRQLADAVCLFLVGDCSSLTSVSSVDELEMALERIAVHTSTSQESFRIEHAPTEVFTHLAEQLRKCSSVFKDAQVFFLLDDISTRYLEVERVGELLSMLLFQSPICAFKFTSEWQTIELGLHSPGQINPIRIDRDLSVFDLGANVFQIITAAGNRGSEFVEQILRQRAQFHLAHPRHSPRDLLGDVALERVALEVASSKSTSRERKHAYRGISCLTSVCVGDIGDVIKLYDEILERAGALGGGLATPIDPGLQSDCFQELSSLRLYDLNRRGGYYKNHALAFAEAAHELLVRSHRISPKPTAVPGEDKPPPRLRQYASIYVRVTTENQTSLKQQIDMLRKLIDAGVFVYTGGSPRTKTRDSNPIQQFKLTYRKIYGLASFIGLANRDRFELSGQDLEAWLAQPSKDVLLASQTRAVSDADEDPFPIDEDSVPIKSTSEIVVEERAPEARLTQRELFVSAPRGDAPESTASLPSPKRIDTLIREIPLEDAAALRVDSILVGLGFEERTRASNEWLAERFAGATVHAVQYPEPGHAIDITRFWADRGVSILKHEYAAIRGASIQMEGRSLVDISGLAKPVIFDAIRRELSEKQRVLLLHAAAEKHYPLQEDLVDLFAAAESGDPSRLLDKLATVIKGESGPYSAVRLIDQPVDVSRVRALIAFASAKHERLFSLLDRREYDFIDVIAPVGDAPRARVARYAAEFLSKNYQNARVSTVDSTDLSTLVDFLDRKYLDLYGVNGASVEIGLTGSKMQGVAAAILAARRRVSEAWYVGPSNFDTGRFSSGVGRIRLFEVVVAGKP